MATTKLGDVYPIIIDKYESFVPLNGGVDMIEKINSVVEHLNRLGQLTTETVNQWNKVMKWVNADGLTDNVNAKIDDLIAKGLFDELLNGFMVDLNTANTTFQDSINSQETTFQNTINGQVNTINSSLALKANQSALDTTNANVTANTTSLADLTPLKNNALNVFSVAGTTPNGVNPDNARIQLAIQTAHNTGVNAVFIPSGYTFMIDVQSPIIVPSNMTILGIKGESTLKIIGSTVANNPNVFYGGINSIFHVGDLSTRQAYTLSAMATNVHFDGLVLDGNYSGINQTGFDTTADSAGIHALLVNNLSIKNCEVKNFLGSGIYTFACMRQVITDNLVHDNGHLNIPASRNGISLAGGYSTGQAIGYAYDAIVSRNIVHNNVDEGIMFAFQKRILISDNIVHDNGDRGIEGDSGYTTTDSGNNVPGDVTIVNNFVYDNTTHGITVNSSNNQKININNNIVRNCGMYALFAMQSSGAEIKITNNMVFDVGTTNDGTQYHAITADGNEVTIQNNVVYNCSNGGGINTPRGLNILISGNKITNTKLSAINLNIWNQGVIGSHSNSINISANIINKSNSHGIYINVPTNTSYNHIRQLTLNGNEVFNYGEGSTAHSSYGIIFASAVRIDSLVISNNSIYEDRATKLGANAIYFQGTTQGNIVNAIFSGNEVSNGSDWRRIEGWSYISNPVFYGNSNDNQFRNSGTISMTTGASTWNVLHGIDGTPTKIFITPQGNLGNTWVTNVNATQFTINVATAPASTTVVSWKAEL